MPDEEKKMVDIDTSGPEVDVELETQQEESEVSVPEEKETVTEVTSPAPLEASDEQQETKTEEAKEDQKDELETYSKDVQRRIAKLTKKWREAERQKEEALQFARIQKDTADKLSKKYSSLETNSLKTKETQIASALQGAKARLAQARESGDIEAEVEIQKDISRLGYEEARLLELKAAREEHQQEEVIPTMNNFQAPKQPQNIVPDEKAEVWGAKNRWFGTDKPMTYTAFDIHETLVNEEGFDPSSDEYYSELDKRIRVAFPTKFANKEETITAETTKPTQIVASARRSVKPGRKTVRLTPSQVAIAKKLGVPLEEYAKQIKIMKEV